MDGADEGHDAAEYLPSPGGGRVDGPAGLLIDVDDGTGNGVAKD